MKSKEGRNEMERRHGREVMGREALSEFKRFDGKGWERNYFGWKNHSLLGFGESQRDRQSDVTNSVEIRSVVVVEVAEDHLRGVSH
jgi:hypothetical protein